MIPAPGPAAADTELVAVFAALADETRWSILVALGEGSYVAAPPARFGSRGAVQWACRPTPANRWLPDAEELILLIRPEILVPEEEETMSQQ